MKITVSRKPTSKAKSLTIYEAVQARNDGPSARGATYWKALLACPREFALRSVVGIEPQRVSENLETGWVYHYCLQQYYESLLAHQKANGHFPSRPTWLWGGARVGMQRAYDVVGLLDEHDEFKEQAKTLERMLNGYFEMYDQRDRWAILAVEETLFYRGVFEYSARLDLLVHDLDLDGTFIVEHKSAASLSSDLDYTYQMDLQVLGQVWLLKECVALDKYPKFKGIRVNIETKQKTPQFHRVDVLPSVGHLWAFEQSMLQYAGLRETMQQALWPQFWHCAGYSRGYSRCQFFDVCHGQPEMQVSDWADQKEPPFGFIRRT